MSGVQGTRSSAFASVKVAKPSTYKVPSSLLTTLSLSGIEVNKEGGREKGRERKKDRRRGRKIGKKREKREGEKVEIHLLSKL